jgi:8-oxo-dGTP pyrophosphatase MutT (NUDIX family)
MEFPRDHRSMLCQQIATYINSHPERKETAETLLQFVLSTPDCFERSHAEGHITGSVWMLNPEGNKALLTLHRKLKLWVQPGGHADGDPDVLRVACREAAEESGITDLCVLDAEIFDVDIHTIPARPATGEPEHLHYDIRYLLQAGHEQFAISDKSDALGWFTREEISHLTPPADTATLRLAALWPTQG